MHCMRALAHACPRTFAVRAQLLPKARPKEMQAERKFECLPLYTPAAALYLYSETVSESIRGRSTSLPLWCVPYRLSCPYTSSWGWCTPVCLRRCRWLVHTSSDTLCFEFDNKTTGKSTHIGMPDLCMLPHFICSCSDLLRGYSFLLQDGPTSLRTYRSLQSLLGDYRPVCCFAVAVV